MNDHLTIGIDLGGTSIKGILSDSQGNILKEISTETGDNTESGIISWKKSIKDITESLRNNSGAKINLAGFAAPGLASPDNRSILNMPGRLQGLENLDLGKYLNIDTYVLNDAHAHLIAESTYGAGKGYRNNGSE